MLGLWSEEEILAVVRKIARTTALAWAGKRGPVYLASLCGAGEGKDAKVTVMQFTHDLEDPENDSAEIEEYHRNAAKIGKELRERWAEDAKVTPEEKEKRMLAAVAASTAETLKFRAERDALKKRTEEELLAKNAKVTIPETDCG